jgi:Peptidase M15
MKIRLITGAIGVALCIATQPAEARRPASEGNDSGAYGGGARILDFDHPGFWSHRQGSRDADSEAPRARREVAPRRRQQTRAARPSPRATSRNTAAVHKPAVAHKPAEVASRAVTTVARQPGGGARGCLSAPARALLERIEGQFGAMQVISTCRPGARIAGTGRTSRHASGNAIDFNAGGRKGEVVRWLIANHKDGGIMTYAGMSHIHVDIGYRFVALNSGGRR